MFGIGTGEILLILVVAMLVVGPERMTVFAREAGEWLAKFRKQTDSLKSEFSDVLDLEKLKADLMGEGESEDETAAEPSVPQTAEAYEAAVAGSGAGSASASNAAMSETVPAGVRVAAFSDAEQARASDSDGEGGAASDGDLGDGVVTLELASDGADYEAEVVVFDDPQVVSAQEQDVALAEGAEAQPAQQGSQEG